MAEYAASLVWGAIQVSLFSMIVFAAVLAARKWISGVVGELLFWSLSLIIVVPVLAMLPMPGWFPESASSSGAAPMETVQANRQASAPMESLVDDSSLRPLPIFNDNEAAQTAGANTGSPDVAAVINNWWTQLRTAADLEHSSEFAANQPSPWLLFISGIMILLTMIGGCRLAYGINGVRLLKSRSQEVYEPKIIHLVNGLANQMKITKAVGVFETGELTTAATIGWRKPTILLPDDWTSWTDGELASAISHELAHVQNNDFLKNLVSQVAVAINFFNPLVHWLGQELRVSQELAADATAARNSGGRTAYLLTMAEMALKRDTNQLGWLAQPFLPTRKTFLRRIEMLKSKRRMRGSRNGAALWFTRIAVGAIAFTCIGFRVPVSDLVANEEGSAPGTAVALNDDVNKLAYVSDQAQIFIAADLERLNEIEGFPEMLSQLTGEPDSESPSFLNDLSNANLLTIQLFDLETGLTPSTPTGMVIRFNEPIELGKKSGDKFVYRGIECFSLGGACTHFPDSLTMVFGSDKVSLERMLDASPSGASIAKWKGSASEHLTQPFTFAISQLGMESLSRIAAASPYSPLWTDSTFCVGSLNVDENMNTKLAASMASKTENQAERVAKTIQAWTLLSGNSLSLMKSTIPQGSETSEAVLASIDAGEAMLESFQVTRNGDAVKIESQTKIESSVISSLLSNLGFDYTRNSRAYDSLTRIRQLSLAMHNYADAHRGADRIFLFPNSANSAPESEFKHSWRIAILPYIEQNELYEQYRFDEAWDSPHNQKVTAKMPECFRHPTQGPDETSSSYYMVTGPGTVFPANGPLALSRIPDGTSNTILFVEAKRDTHWAKPEDIAFEATTILDQIGGFQNGEAIISLCDGSAHKFFKEGGSELIKSLVLAADGIAPAWNQ